MDSCLRRNDNMDLDPVVNPRVDAVLHTTTRDKDIRRILLFPGYFYPYGV